MKSEEMMTELLARVVLSRQELPAWLADGASIYFANVRMASEGVDVGRVPHERLRRLQAQLRDGSYTRLEKLFSCTSNELSIEEHRAAWGLVFWLAHSGDDQWRQKHADALKCFLGDLAHGKAAQSFEVYLDVQLVRLEGAWREWIMGLDSEHPYAGVAGKRLPQKALERSSQEQAAQKPIPGKNRIAGHVSELPPVEKSGK